MMRSSWLRALPILLALTAPARGELIPSLPPPSPMPRDLPMHSVLYEVDVVAKARQLDARALEIEMSQRGLVMHEGRIHVEVVGPEGSVASERVSLDGFGGVVTQSFANRLDAWVPPDRLVEVARSLPAGFRLERANTPVPDQVAGEGPGANVINSAGYRDAGSNGGFRRIAIIDTQYSGLTNARNNGDAPTAANTTTIDFATGAFESGGTHGTGCLEAAFDHCPGATWFLYKVDAVTDLGLVVSDALFRGVHIISHSMSYYNLGWDDDIGAACDAANNAGQNGILFVTSAGNRALDHFQGNFSPGNGDANWHDWATGDEALALTVSPNLTATCYLSWNTLGGTYDYDLYLYDANLTTVLASSTNGGNTYEQISWMNSSPNPVSVRLAIFRQSGGITELEVFGDNNSTNWEYTIAAGSTTSPSNATNPFVISVGAVDWNSYAQASGSDPIANYSSRGPSNNGRMLPDLVGPTKTQGFTYPAASGGFSGTSCATPNVAGAMCAFWSDEAQFRAAGVHWVIREQARVAWRDWGTAGDDNVYGAGACHLVNFVTNTTWLARAYGNTSNDPFGPYYTVAAAQSNGAVGGRIMIVLGGHYPELVTLNKQLTYETIGSSALLGP